MSVFTKDFLSIVASMTNQMRATQKKITDFRTGGVARTVVEGCAIEVDELYQQMLNGLKDAIPVVLYLAFGFDLLPAAFANGVVLITLPAVLGTDTLIPSGTQVTTLDGSKVYLTISDVTILAGQLTIAADVRASVSGTIDNCGIGDIQVIVNGPSGATVTNPAAFQNGADPETDDQRKLRFIAFIDSLSRGTLGSIEYGATTTALVDANGVITERVTEANAVELYQTNPTNPLGHITLYIFNGGSGASADLLALCRKIIDGYTDGGGNKIEGYKAGGVQVDIVVVTLQTFNATYRVVCNDGVLTSDQIADLTAEITQVVNANGIGKTLYVDAQTAALRNVQGVISATPTTPPNDLVLAPGIRLVPGVFTFQPVAA